MRGFIQPTNRRPVFGQLASGHFWSELFAAVIFFCAAGVWFGLLVHLVERQG